MFVCLSVPMNQYGSPLHIACKRLWEGLNYYIKILLLDHCAYINIYEVRIIKE